MSDTFSAEVAVIGGGPAGLVAAIALATAGVDTLLIAPPAEPDHRTTALLAGSVTALETLGVWPACVPHAAPLRKIRLIDATQRLIRAPEVLFTSAEIDLDAFGHNIENRHLIAALEARAAALKLPRIAGAALSIASDACRRDHQARQRRSAGKTRHRRRRPALAVPRRGRHRHQAADLSADRADAQSGARAAARRHIDRIPHRKRAVHARAPARPAFEPGLRARPRPRRRTCRDERRGAFAPRSNAARIRCSAQ